MPVWRRDDEQGGLALRITQRGLAAIQVEDGTAQATAEECRDGKPAADLVLNKRSSRVAAARAKKNQEQVSATLCHARPEGFETGAGDRDAADPARRKHHGNHEGNRLAAALGARLSCRRGAQTPRVETRLEDDRRRAVLSDHGHR